MISPHTAPGTKVVVIRSTHSHPLRVIPHLNVGDGTAEGVGQGRAC